METKKKNVWTIFLGFVLEYWTISCDLFIIIKIIIIHFFRWVISECTKAVATSLIPLVKWFPLQGELAP